MVDLYQPWLQLVVQHDVESKNLKAHAVVDVIWLRCPVVVGHYGLRRAESLYNDPVYLLLDELNVRVYRGKVLIVEPLQRALVSNTVVLLVVVELEVLAVLVYGVVSQMLSGLPLVMPVGGLIRLRTKPGQAILKDEYVERITPSQEYVDP